MEIIKCGAPIRKKNNKFFEHKIFLVQQSLIFVNMKYFFMQHQLFLLTENTFSCNNNLF